MVQRGCRLTHFDVLHIFQICVNPTQKKKKNVYLQAHLKNQHILRKYRVEIQPFGMRSKKHFPAFAESHGRVQLSNWLYCRRLQPQARLVAAAPIEGLQALRHWGPSLLCTRWEICGHDIILFPQWVSLHVSVASSYVYRVPKSIGQKQEW